MKKRFTADRVYLLVTGLIIQAVLLIPWIPGVDRHFNIYNYWMRMKEAESLEHLIMTDFGFQDMGLLWSDVKPMTSIFQFHLVLLILLQILGIVNLILVFGKKKRTFLCMVNLVIASANLFSMPESFLFYLEGWVPKLYLVVILILQGIHLIGFKLIDAWEDAKEEQRQIREREERQRQERKRRLAFEGKYSELFYRIIWKNFKTSWETYRLFIIVGGLSVSFIFSGIGMREMLSNVYGTENLVAGQGLGTVLLNFLVMSIVISAFLVTLVLLFYLKHHMKNYTLFINLGMRSRTLYLFVGAQLLSCIVVALVAGTVLGNVILFICRTVIRKGFEGSIVFQSVTGKTYLLTLFVSFLIYLISAMATHDIYVDTGGSSARYKEVMKEKMPGRLSPVFMILGAVMMFGAFKNFAKRPMAESVVLLAVFFVGLFLFFKHIWNLYLKRRERKASVYYRGLLQKNYFYHHFKTAFRYMFLITLLHICVLFVFSKEVVSSEIAQEPQTMFPYDYVCMATDEDKHIFEEIETKNHAEVRIYPMVRVTSVDNSPRMDNIRSCMQPQGQNIGISESTYKLLCKEIGCKPRKLDLSADGKKVFLLYQEDKSIKAHPIDYYPNRTNPYLHIGQPVLRYDYLRREEIFMPREVTGEQTGSLVGNFRQGEHENIIVFSDEYFARVQDDWRTTDYNTGEKLKEEDAVEDVTVHHWPDRLVLIRAEEKEKKEVEEKLEDFSENHKFDEHFDSVVRSWYSRDEQVSQMKSERFMKSTVSVFIIIIMTIVIFTLLYMKAESEMEEKKRQQSFLECMGMRDKERLRLIKSEISVLLWLPFCIATIAVIIFTEILWKIRIYTLPDYVAYTKIWMILYLMYGVIQLFAAKILEHYIIRKVEGTHAGNHKN